MLVVSRCEAGQNLVARVDATDAQVAEIRNTLAGFCEIPPPKGGYADGEHYTMKLSRNGVSVGYEFGTHRGDPAGRWATGDVVGLMASIVKQVRPQLPDAGADADAASSCLPEPEEP